MIAQFNRPSVGGHLLWILAKVTHYFPGIMPLLCFSFRPSCQSAQVDRKEDTAVVWFTQHLDMPEWEDQSIVNKDEADIWTVLKNGARPRRDQSVWSLQQTS